jgi:hypothetical protein
MTRSTLLRAAPVWVLALALAACGPPTKHEILSKAENAETKAELEAALGAPDERDKVGPLERWTYRAEDGVVTFVITGETVRLQTTD